MIQDTRITYLYCVNIPLTPDTHFDSSTIGGAANEAIKLAKAYKVIEELTVDKKDLEHALKNARKNEDGIPFYSDGQNDESSLEWHGVDMCP